MALGNDVAAQPQESSDKGGTFTPGNDSVTVDVEVSKESVELRDGGLGSPLVNQNFIQELESLSLVEVSVPILVIFVEYLHDQGVDDVVHSRRAEPVFVGAALLGSGEVACQLLIVVASHLFAPPLPAESAACVGPLARVHGVGGPGPDHILDVVLGNVFHNRLKLF